MRILWAGPLRRTDLVDVAAPPSGLRVTPPPGQQQNHGDEDGHQEQAGDTARCGEVPGP